MNVAAILWFVLLVGFLVVEAGTVTVVSVWFAAGSLVAMVASLLGAEVWLQVVLFLVVSALLLLALRPVTKRYFTPRLNKTNIDSVIGSIGIVTGKIDNLSATGKVKLGAMEWTARSSSGAVIEEGTKIRVDRIEGVKVFVTPEEVLV